MFGLTVEKLIVIGLIAAVIIGPHRLPLYAEKLASFIRDVRRFVDTTRGSAERELGVPIDTAEWNSRIQQYDPRRIVRDALRDGGAPERTPEQESDAGDEESEPEPPMRERWVVVGGSSGHPVRRRIMEPVPPDEQADADDVGRAGVDGEIMAT